MITLIIIPADAQGDFSDNTDCALVRAYFRKFPKRKLKYDVYAFTDSIRINGVSYDLDQPFGSAKFKDLARGERKRFTVKIIGAK